MVLEEITTSMSGPLRDRGARDANRALRLPRRIARSDSLGSRSLTPSRLRRCHSLGNSQLNRVALNLIVKRGTLDAEEFGRSFLVPAAFRQCLENGGPLQVVESLYALAR